MKKFLNEESQIYSDAHAKELLQLRVNYNKELQTLNNKFAKLESDLAVKHMKLAQQQQTIKTAQRQETPAKTQPAQTGTVTTAGQPVNADGSPVTKESYGDILKVRQRIDETKYDTTNVDSESLADLKNYMDADNIPYIEDEDETTLQFDETQLDDEWFDELEDLGLEEINSDIETDDILDVEDEDEDENEESSENEDKENLIDADKQIDEDKVFYVKINDDGKEFIGKVYKLFDEGDWRAKIVDGESETFEKLNYDPSFDEIDIIAFLRENYDDAELIDKSEFTDHVENPNEEPKEIEESHSIPTFDQFVNETLKFSDGEEFEASGNLRLEERKDGWYVIGEGMLIPVKDEADGEDVINQINMSKR